jgi:hypothetical protein
VWRRSGQIFGQNPGLLPNERFLDLLIYSDLKFHRRPKFSHSRQETSKLILSHITFPPPSNGHRGQTRDDSLTKQKIKKARTGKNTPADLAE